MGLTRSVTIYVLVYKNRGHDDMIPFRKLASQPSSQSKSDDFETDETRVSFSSFVRGSVRHTDMSHVNLGLWLSIHAESIIQEKRHRFMAEIVQHLWAYVQNYNKTFWMHGVYTVSRCV